MDLHHVNCESSLPRSPASGEFNDRGLRCEGRADDQEEDLPTESSLFPEREPRRGGGEEGRSRAPTGVGVVVFGLSALGEGGGRGRGLTFEVRRRAVFDAVVPFLRRDEPLKSLKLTGHVTGQFQSFPPGKFRKTIGHVTDESPYCSRRPGASPREEGSFSADSTPPAPKTEDRGFIEKRLRRSLLLGLGLRSVCSPWVLSIWCLADAVDGNGGGSRRAPRTPRGNREEAEDRGFIEKRLQRSLLLGLGRLSGSEEASVGNSFFEDLRLGRPRRGLWETVLISARNASLVRRGKIRSSRRGVRRGRFEKMAAAPAFSYSRRASRLPGG